MGSDKRENLPSQFDSGKRRLEQHELTKSEKADIAQAGAVLAELKSIQAWFDKGVKPKQDALIVAQQHFDASANLNYMPRLIAKRKTFVQAIRTDNRTEALNKFNYQFQEAVAARQFNLHAFNERIKQCIIILPRDDYHVPLLIQKFQISLSELSRDVEAFNSYLLTPRRGLYTTERQARLHRELSQSTEPEKEDI